MEVMVFLEGQAAKTKQHPYTVAANLATRERHQTVGASLPRDLLILEAPQSQGF
ncbi:hypothetical protein ACTXN4_10235 [Pseudomonas helleri]|jgi:hypothetical protein|uniref:hypothetical protein n=1 Tax=Pseudomonas TaxID=286 RepID=UPI0012FBCB34|nr:MULTISPECIES: hypothetical protein [Pseudomonas]